MSERNALEDDLRRLLSQGRKIPAIKLYKDRTGVCLSDAKQAVEALQRGVRLPNLADADANRVALASDLASLLHQGRKLEAIKLYRERMGVGLVAAKNAVEQFARDGYVPTASATEEGYIAELLPALRMGDKREAMRLYRRRTGATRREARRVVNELTRRHGMYDRESACLVTALLLLMLGVAALLILGGILFLARG